MKCPKCGWELYESESRYLLCISCGKAWQKVRMKDYPIIVIGIFAILFGLFIAFPSPIQGPVLTILGIFVSIFGIVAVWGGFRLNEFKLREVIQ